MLGEIAWAIVCFGIGWACRAKFGTLAEMNRYVKSRWDGLTNKKTEGDM